MFWRFPALPSTVLRMSFPPLVAKPCAHAGIVDVLDVFVVFLPNVYILRE
jgi:hypothetical protein